MGVQKIAICLSTLSQSGCVNMSGRTKSATLTASGDTLRGSASPEWKKQRAESRFDFEPPRAKNVAQRKIGNDGRRITVSTNHFEMKFKPAFNGLVHHYDATFMTSAKREWKKSDRPVLVKAIEHMKKKYSDTFPNPAEIVFDGQKNVFTRRDLPLGDAGSFVGRVKVEASEDLASEVILTITLKKVGTINMTRMIEEFVANGSTLSRPSTAVQVLNVIMGMSALINYETVGRCYFSDGAGKVIQIGNGKSLWVGTFQSVRLGWKPMLNLDIANKPAYFAIPVVQFACDLLKRHPNDLGHAFERREIDRLQRELAGLKIRFNRPDSQKRDYRVVKLMQPANRLFMTLDKDNKRKKITIEQYFAQEYSYDLKYPDLPCLHVGNPNNMVYIPMELAQLKKQVLPRSKRLSDEEVATMIRQTAMPPAERQSRIEDNLRKMNKAFKNDPFVNAFGIKISEECTTISARILEPPVLGYCKNGALTEQPVSNGRWDRNKQRLAFVMGMHLKNWGVFDMTYTRQDHKSFIDALYEVGRERNLMMDYPMYCHTDERNYDHIVQDFKGFARKIEHRNGYIPQLIMVLSPSKGPLYSLIKHTGDVSLGIPTQFVLVKNVVNPRVQVLHNICMKLNAKLGGVNQVIHEISRPPVLTRPVMFMGADVTHPTPDQLKFKPSIAAVVASLDPNAANYNCEVRLQYGDGAVEVIQKMEEMTKKLLLQFYEHSGFKYKPEKIFFYRDGVGESQFLQVLNFELVAIRKACQSLNKNYEPKITFLVAQKRHNTRFFPKNTGDGVGKMGNIPPGTVVDTIITHPTEQSFFLASHEGIQGTTKPTSYHILWDDNKLQPDEIQSLTYYLCHLYPRCERSVSYPAPTYFAHLAAFRGREHHNAILSKGHCGDPKAIQKMENITLQNYFL